MPCYTKWKFAILVGISEYLISADAKYCAFDIHGDLKYYVCPRTEYCCNFGCCVSPGFQMYHLWYYWLLVIIMFLVCSGGGWWYRYWLQGRYRAGASSISHRPYNSRAHIAFRSPNCQAQQARISYNSARNTVLLHRMWKGPHRGATSPAYNNAAASSTHYQSTSVVLSDTNCPYYQFYGPPPSYETVIAQTRGKATKPMSSEQSGTVLQNTNSPPCFAHSYSLPSRMDCDTSESIVPVQNGVADMAVVPTEIFSHSHRMFNDETRRPELRTAQSRYTASSPEAVFPFCKESFKRFILLNRDTYSETENILQTNVSDVDNQTEKREQGTVRIDCTNSARGGRNLKPMGESVSRVHGQSSSMRKVSYSRIQGGSLKLSRSGDKRNTHSRLEGIVRDEQTLSPNATSQSNPSNNVILASSNCNITIDMSVASTNVNDADEHRLFLSSAQGSTNSNLESNRKLDRSRSLD